MKKSFQITLSGVSTALTVICIVLSYYLPVMTLSFLALSGITLMLPLVIGSVRGGILTYLASVILGFVFTNVYAMIPFALVFGAGTVVMYLVLRYLKNKWYLSLILKSIFINLAIFGIYKIIGFEQIFNILDKVGIKPTYYWTVLIATPIYLLYDYLLQNIFKYIQVRMKKIFKDKLPQDK